MSIRRTVQIAIFLSSAVMATAGAQIAGTQFSADMVSRGPDGQVSTGKMYVGDGRMRVEMNQQGKEVVRITDQTQGRELLLFPDRKGYMERDLAADRQDSPASANADPCAGLDGVNCRKVGEEDVGGRAAVKWEMSVVRDGQTLTGVQWIDVERGLPLKYRMPNGQSMELRMVGKETIDGRAVEKWEMTSAAPNQQPVKTFQWYDPELKLSVREEFPGGYVRELDRIQVGDQPDALFDIPAGYSRMESPPPTQR
ncbi:hypothetical protein ThidrDRAFT_0429 [Thiorhodococcus drewsii AZ1]|uniref:DUF4412 domain-containing protein n=1 Tax=Thiorhodococcus drewsii AZ1 TaxID=765913 RepID=G2DWP0_9GAMM|nr:hypothetical protein [Thiorhodococcus drewsii]EGV33740.1 hypothetical protein ThidrDRAFT_0429 [Thiorhodococcus drewsii AZ1]